MVFYSESVASASPRGRRLVPQFILDCAARGESSGRFLAAGLFLDISGFRAVMNVKPMF